MNHNIKAIHKILTQPMRSFTKWFNDETFRRLLKNVGWLVSGKSIGALLAFLTTAVEARALGVEQFGLISLILAYSAIIGEFASFNPWQALIKFGAESLEHERLAEFMSQVKLGFLLDVIGSVSGTVIAVAGALIFAGWQGWGEDVSRMAAVFSLSLLFNVSGTPTGILRLLNRFELLSAQTILKYSIALAGTVFIYLKGGDIWGYLIVMLISTIIGNLFLLTMSIGALRRKQLTHLWHTPIKHWKPFIMFSIWTYISSTLDIPVKQLDIIIVSRVISIGAAGIYKIIKQVTQVIGLLADPFYQAIYPQFSSMIAAHDSKGAIKYALKISILTMAVIGFPSVLLAITSFWWLVVLFGEGFADGAFPLSIFLLIKMVDFIINPIHPLFTAMGYVKQNSIIVIFTNILYLVLAWQLGLRIGLLGFAIATGFEFTTRAILKAIIIKRNWLRPQIFSS